MIVAGFGFRRAAGQASLAAALAAAEGRGDRAEALAAPADKLDALAGLSAATGLPAIGISAAELRAVATPTQSAASLRARATGSVAEAAALAAAGPGARLLVSRCISPDRLATCALAEGNPK